MWKIWGNTSNKGEELMALIIKSRIPFTAENPYRSIRPATSKIIFLSCEGSVTEEEYFARVSEIFEDIKSKIQFISVSEDAVHTHHKNRTLEQIRMLGRSKPKQLVEKIEQFKLEKEDIYQFSKHPEDEFWIVTDIDKNLFADYKDDFIEALNMCDNKQYGYAISNPFFEIWLLLHHDDADEEDKAYAVTKEHEYESTSHFRERLHNLHVPLKKEKHIEGSYYNKENIFQAIKRAKKLHIDKNARYPEYFATTVYELLEKMIDMLPEEMIE